MTKQHGFTLIELLLYVVIIATLLGSVTAFLGLSLSARVKNQSIVEVNQQGIAILERLTTTIRGAESITSPTIGASSSSLTLALSDAIINPTIVDASTSTPEVLQVKEGTGSAVALTNNKVVVSGLTFKNLSRSGTPGVVQVSFVLSRVNNSGRNEYDYQKTFTTTVTIR